MFGMDMGLGMGMMDRGAMDMGIGRMDMGIGAMDMAMGRPLLGAEMMGIGAMDMNMGAMEMNMGMGMMDRGMMGMGGFGMGYGMMGGGIGICPPGCMMACCRPVVVCPPGCMRSCCVSQQVIVRNVPYNEDSGFVQLPPIQPNPRPQNYPQQAQQARQYQVTPNDGDIQQQMMNEQMRLQRQKNQQLLYKQKLEQEKVQLQREKLQFEQKQIEQQRNEQMRMQQAQQQQRYQQIRLQQKMGNLPQYKAERQPSFAVDQNRIKSNPYGIEIIYQGNIYMKSNEVSPWMQIKGTLTMNSFQECNIDGLNKIKIKNTRHGANFRVIKLSFNGRADMFIAVPPQEQPEWMCRFIWTRLNTMNRPFNQNQIVNFNQNLNGNVYYEGEIIRKSFFNGWQPKYACVSACGLIITSNKGGEVTHHVKSVAQIWTRFDFVQGNMLIIKFHALGRKNEIGIPIEHGLPWLKALYTLTLP